MREKNNDVRRLGLLVLVMAALMTLPFIGMGHFYTRGEPREALVAVAMLDQGNFILPYFQGEFAFKPPMLHWLVALFSLPQGYVSETTSRLPSAIASIAMCYSFFLFFARRYNVGKVLIAAFILMTSFEVHRAAMTCRVDMVLTAFMVGGFMALYRWGEHNWKGIPWLASLLISGAILTKGPIGAILPCAVMVVQMVMRKQRVGSVLLAVVKVAVLSSVLPLCWYVVAYNVGGDKFLQLMMEENFGRFLGKMSYESHENGPLYYIPILLAGLLPWTLLLVFGLILVRWRNLWQNKMRGWWMRFRSMDPIQQWSAIVAIVVFVFYEIPKSKRSVYLLPMYPFLSILIADYLVWLLSEHRRVLKVYAWVISSIGAVFSILLIVLHEISLESVGFLGHRVIYQLAELQKMPMGLAYILASSFPIIVIVAIWYFRKRINVPLFLSFGVWIACCMTLDGVLNPAIKNSVPDYAFAQAVKAYQPDGKVAFFHVDREEPAYVVDYYLDDNVTPCKSLKQLPANGYIMLRESNKEIFEEGMSEFKLHQVLITDNKYTSFKGNLLLYKFEKK